MRKPKIGEVWWTDYGMALVVDKNTTIRLYFGENAKGKITAKPKDAEDWCIVKDHLFLYEKAKKKNKQQFLKAMSKYLSTFTKTPKKKMSFFF